MWRNFSLKITGVTCLFLWLINPLPGSGQSPGSLYGRISDGESGEPLAGVNVFTGGSTGTTSDFSGSYSLVLEPGEYQITFHFLGYAEQVHRVSIPDGASVLLDVRMKVSSNLLDEVVVSAGRYEQKLSELTVSMEVIKARQLSELHIESLDLMLERIPGISILDGQPSIRGGSGYSYGAGSRVLMLVDDLPMISADAGDVKWNYLPMENARQVEVIKGASSVLYGSSALNGIINLRTRYPGPEPATEITMQGGMYLDPDRKELVWWKSRPYFTGLSLSHSRKAGKLDLTMGANIHKNTGYREFEYENRFRGNLGLRYTSEKVRGLSMGINASAMYVNQSDFLLWVDADSGAYRQDPEAINPLTGHRLNLDPFVEYVTPLGDKHSLRGRLYSVFNETENRERNSRSRLWFAEYRYLKRFRSRLTWTSGMSLTRNVVRANLYDDHSGANMALYSQVDASMIKRLKLSLGARWELNALDDSLYYSIPVLRAGLNYQAGKQTFFRASLGQGYRFPSVAEKYTRTDIGGLRIFPNPELEPERGWSAEVGIKQGFARGKWKGFADLALFWTEYHQMIEFTFGIYPPSPDDVPSLEDVGFKALNQGSARINGVELGLMAEGELGPLGIRYTGGYTYMNPLDLSFKDSVMADSDAHVLKYRRRHMVKGDLELSLGRIFTGTTIQHHSRMINVDAVFLDPFVGELLLPGFPAYWEWHSTAYTLFDFRLGWDVSGMIRLSAVLRNAMNREYLGRPGDLGPPRHLSLQIRMNF